MKESVVEVPTGLATRWMDVRIVHNKGGEVGDRAHDPGDPAPGEFGAVGSGWLADDWAM